jgi:DNA repair protein RecO (recombination protein O)
MDWSDSAIVLSARAHGETSAVLQVLSRAQGRHAGLVRGRARQAAGLQPGTEVEAHWRARLADHLGVFTLEVRRHHAACWLDDPPRLAALTSACALVETSLPERAPHPGVHDGLAELLAGLGETGWPLAYVRWELSLLAELGYGLDLSRCAATGGLDDLCYVSPKSGRAVSAAAGAPWRDRLLALPGFLVGGAEAGPGEIRAGLDLVAYFLKRHGLAGVERGLPPARERLADCFPSPG